MQRKMALLPDELALALQALTEAIREGFADAQAKAVMPMVSRRFMQAGVHVYFRCLVGGSVAARYQGMGTHAKGPPQVSRAVVIADITLDERQRGQGFLLALVSALSEPQLGLSFIELENVFNEQLVDHLQRTGWVSRNGMAMGGCWVTATGPLPPA